MVTPENIMEVLEKNPKQKKVVENTLSYFLPKWFGSKIKYNRVENMDEEDIKFLSQCVFLMNVSNAELENAKKSLDYDLIFQSVLSFKNGNSFVLDELCALYKTNLKKEEQFLKEKIEQYKYNHLPNKKKVQINNLKAKNQSEKANEIIEQHFSDNAILKIINEEYERFMFHANLFQIDVFTPYALEINEWIIEKLACAIYSPKTLSSLKVEYLLENDNVIPYDWYFSTALSIPEYKNITEGLKDAETWETLYVRALSRIKDHIKIPIYQIQQRKKIICDVLFLLEHKRFDAIQIIIFPVIEGLLRDAVNLVGKQKKIFLDNGNAYDYINDCELKGNKIRDLLEKTYFNEYINQDFLKYFCEELYNERNPVSHGNQICGECERNHECIIHKIMVLDYVLELFINLFEEDIFFNFESLVDEEKLNTYLKQYEIAMTLPKIQKNNNERETKNEST